MTVTVDTISALTSCTTALMLLSPIPDLYQMFKTRNCGHTSIIPLISIFGNSHMWMTYGFLDHNYSPLFSTFVLGDVFAIIYITIYYRATTERQYVGRLIGFVVGFLTLVTIYVVLAIYGVTHQTRKQLLQVVGYIGIAVSVVLFASPFEKALQVIRHRLAVFLSINLIVASTVNNGILVVYTLVDLDWFLFAPNMLIFAFGLVQTALYFIFHPKTHPLILPQDEEVASKLERAESSPQSIKRSHSVEYICMLESPTVCIEPIHTI